MGKLAIEKQNACACRIISLSNAVRGPLCKECILPHRNRSGSPFLFVYLALFSLVAIDSISLYLYIYPLFEVFCSVRETSRRRHAVLQRGRCIFVRSRFIRSVCIVMYEGCISREKIAYVILKISAMKI